MTKAGTRAVHDQTPDERWTSVKQIYHEKYATASTRQALDEIFSLKNIGLLAGAEAALATPAAPFVIAGGGSVLLIEEAKAHSTALEIKRLTLAPTKPSDLDAAAQKLAELATQGKVIAGTAMLGGVASAGSRLGARMTEGARMPRLTPEVQEALTPEGVRVPVRNSRIESIHDPMEVSISSDKANDPHIKAGDRPPYGGTRAQEIVLKQDTIFVRVHGPDNLTSKWMMRAKDIEGLTARQIKNKFALPELPTQISEVHVPAGTRLRIGSVKSQEG